jgi:thiamine-monophosphate kinase
MRKRKMDEFELIAHYFTQQKISRADVIVDIGDDCALLDIPTANYVAITTDTLVNGVHFPVETSAFDVGYKSLAVNLSDLAAMGAIPTWVSLALTLPQLDETWLADFSRGFFELATRHSIQLIGGDMTRGPLSITITAQGLVPKNQAIQRQGAKAGDLIYVTNDLGDAGLALSFLKYKTPVAAAHQNALLTRLNRPEPRVDIGIKLRNIASSAIDISDGLAADLGHILKKNHVGANIHVDKLPLSAALQATLSAEDAIHLALNAGDDYELCFTIHPGDETLLHAALSECGSHYTQIGTITHQTGLNLEFTDGRKYHGNIEGYQHFRTKE